MYKRFLSSSISASFSHQRWLDMTPEKKSFRASPPSLKLSRENRRRERARSAQGRRAAMGVTLLAALLVRQSYCGADAAHVTADLAGVPSSTNLGQLAQECSNYCHAGVNGLDLWLSLEQECISMDTMVALRHRLAGGDAQPASPLLSSSSASSRSSPSGEAAFLIGVDSAYTGRAEEGWSLLQSVLLCVAVVVPGLFAGFRKGSRLAGSVPTVAAGVFCSLP